MDNLLGARRSHSLSSFRTQRRPFICGMSSGHLITKSTNAEAVRAATPDLKRVRSMDLTPARPKSPTACRLRSPAPKSWNMFNDKKKRKEKVFRSPGSKIDSKNVDRENVTKTGDCVWFGSPKASSTTFG